MQKLKFVTDSNPMEMRRKNERERNEIDGMRKFCLSLFCVIGEVVEEFVEAKLRSEDPAKSPCLWIFLWLARNFPSPWRVDLEIEAT